MRVRFLVSRVVQDHHAGTPQETRFELGVEYDLPEASAQHWINRQVAVAVDGNARTTSPATGGPTSGGPPEPGPAPEAKPEGGNGGGNAGAASGKSGNGGKRGRRKKQ